MSQSNHMSLKQSSSFSSELFIVVALLLTMAQNQVKTLKPFFEDVPGSEVSGLRRWMVCTVQEYEDA